MPECILAAICVCRGNLAVTQNNLQNLEATKILNPKKSKAEIQKEESDNMVLTSTKYLEIITIFDETKDTAPAQRIFVQDFKWLNIDKWNVKEKSKPL